MLIDILYQKQVKIEIRSDYKAISALIQGYELYQAEGNSASGKVANLTIYEKVLKWLECIAKI